MSSQIIAILVLGGMFVIATMLPINIGILALVASFVVGTFVFGLEDTEIFAGFPVSLFITVVGVTYLFSVAKLNGTIDLLVQGGIRLVRGRAILVPWVLFAVAGTLTALGTFTPAAVALLVPIGMSFAFTYRISPLMVGMMVICGAHAGAFSPMAVSGALVSGVVAQSGMEVSHAALVLREHRLQPAARRHDLPLAPPPRRGELRRARRTAWPPVRMRRPPEEAHRRRPAAVPRSRSRRRR